jgi:hypothetical protein
VSAFTIEREGHRQTSAVVDALNTRMPPAAIVDVPSVIRLQIRDVRSHVGTEIVAEIGNGSEDARTLMLGVQHLRKIMMCKPSIGFWERSREARDGAAHR